MVGANEAEGRVAGWSLLARLTGTSWRARAVRGAIVVVPGLAVLAPTLGWCPPLLLMNTGDSMPVGLYALAPGQEPTRGAVVALRHPAHFDLPWLLKRVEGVAGDTYCWDETAGTHRLDGRAMPPPDPDAEAMGIDIWRGCVTLGPGEVVGYGRSPDSYDSRYAPIGIVATSRLWGVYRPVWVGR